MRARGPNSPLRLSRAPATLPSPPVRHRVCYGDTSVSPYDDLPRRHCARSGWDVLAAHRARAMYAYTRAPRAPHIGATEWLTSAAHAVCMHSASAFLPRPVRTPKPAGSSSGTQHGVVCPRERVCRTLEAHCGRLRDLIDEAQTAALTARGCYMRALSTLSASRVRLPRSSTSTSNACGSAPCPCLEMWMTGVYTVRCGLLLLLLRCGERVVEARGGRFFALARGLFFESNVLAGLAMEGESARVS